MNVLGIDPGTYNSAYVIWDGASVLEHGYLANDVLKQRLTDNGYDKLAIEDILLYGINGNEVRDTIKWMGRFDHERTATWLDNVTIRVHLCANPKANQSAIRSALIDRFGGKGKAIGSKGAPGPLKEITAHKWSALAVAVTAYDQIEREGK